MSTSTQIDQNVLREMLDAACHFGHKTSKWNPKMRRYLYGERDGVHIIDLVKSYEHLQKALEFLKDQVSKGKTVLLVCTKLQAKKLIEEAGKATGMPYVAVKWIPGLLTNYPTIRKRIRYLHDLKDEEKMGGFEKYTKKEAVGLRKTIQKLEETLGGVADMVKLPDVIFLADSVRDHNPLKEANRLKIPVVGVCDSNADPDTLTIPIPGNDDAVKSLEFFITRVKDAIREGQGKKV